MRIALVALHFGEYASRLAIALAANHHVMLILSAANARAELTRELRAKLGATVAVHYLEVRRWRDPRVLATSLRINAILERFSPEVLHVQELHPVLGAWMVFRNRRHIPVIMTVHDPIYHSGESALTSWRRAMLAGFRGLASRLIVHGPNSRKTLQRFHPAVAGKVDIVPHGVLGRSHLDESAAPSEPGTFLFFGRIHAYKGLEYYLDAGAILNGRGREFRLIVAGTGADLERYRRSIEAMPWVELIDRYIEPDELPALFRRTTAMVLPYTDATQSGVGAMAFGHGRPVIATEVGDLPAVVLHGRNGLVVPPRDAVALADAMDRLLLDRALRESLAAGALEFARAHLDWPRVAALSCEVYRRARRDRRLARAQRAALR